MEVEPPRRRPPADDVEGAPATAGPVAVSVSAGGRAVALGGLAFAGVAAVVVLLLVADVGGGGGGGDRSTVAALYGRGVGVLTLDTVNATCPVRTDAEASRLGNGWCDTGEPYNTEGCGFDGGDCCDVSLGVYDCRDPASPHYNQSAPRGPAWPAPLNPRFSSPGEGRQVSTEWFVTHYNNFYDVDPMTKYVYMSVTKSQREFLEQPPWVVVVDGLVERPMTIDVRDLVGMFHMEQRLYRLRCVEAWSIVVPWVGFPLRKLVEAVSPLPSAKYVRFESMLNKEKFPEQGHPAYSYPYVEGLAIEEATNDLAFLAIGLYNRTLPAQSGAPIRLALPWKYGFKSIKSIVKISFVEEQPVNFWKATASSEYGFWANVNPNERHPRWSQANERVYVDTNQFGVTMIPTQLYNGYAEEVEHLYNESMRVYYV